MLCLAAAHALVKLDDGMIVGDPMEKTTLDALEWTLNKGASESFRLAPNLTPSPPHLAGDIITPAPSSPHKVTLQIKRRFQFSSALKRMSTISLLPPSSSSNTGKLLAAVKGAPETIRGMLAVVPQEYDDTYKWYTRQGSRVLALAMKEMDWMNSEKVCAWALFLFLSLHIHFLLHPIRAGIRMLMMMICS